MSKTFLSRNAMRNLIDYSQAKSVLSDYFSPMAISGFGSDMIDVNEFYFKGHAMASDKPSFRPFLRLAIFESGHYQAVGLTLREDWPGAFRVHGETDNWKVQQDAYFLSDKALRIQYRLIPRGKRDEPEAIVFGGLNQGEVSTKASVKPYADGQEIELDFSRTYLMYVSKTDAVFRGRVKFACQDGFVSAELHDGIAIPSQAFTTGQLATSNVALSDKLHWQGQLRFVKQDDGSWLAQVNVAVEYNGQEPRLETKAWSLDQAVARWEAYFDQLPIPADDSIHMRRKTAQAIITMAYAGIRSKGYGNFSETLGLCACAVTWASTDFFWDHMISAAALSVIDGELQASAVIHFLQHCSGGRLSPGILMAYPVYGQKETPPDGCYAPIASWTVYKAHLCGNNKPDLALLYPYLKALNRGWFGNMDRDGDGIPEWMNSGHPADNSPLFDEYSPKPGMTNFPIPPFISVNLTSYLYQDCKILAEMAKILGKQEDLTLWQKEAQRLETILLQKCWNQEDLFFYDINTKGQQNKVKTFFGLLPLWAGIPLDANTIKQTIERHLLNPAEFWGDIPFPSVAYNEASYDPDGYWRGRTWPHVYFWNAEILQRYGYTEQASFARERHLAIVATDRTHVENMGSNYKLLTPGEPHYNWGAAVDLFWYYNWHQNPVAL